MAQMAIVKYKQKFFVYSWTTGLAEVEISHKITTDDDALAYAMYLSRNGREEEAELFLDQYCK